MSEKKRSHFSMRWGGCDCFYLEDIQFLSEPIEYDDIVDTSTFIPDSENVRTASLSGAGGKKGVYDDVENLPSDLAVRIRSGKLDRAEIAQELEKATKDALDEVDKIEKDNLAKKASEISKARQDYLDSKTGFNPSGQSNG